MHTQERLQRIRTAAHAGQADARHELARYYDAIGNAPRAVRWMTHAVQQQHAPSELQLAVWMLLGHNLPYQPESAARLIGHVAQNGDLFAMNMLASLYASGHGIPQSWDKAINCLLNAAQRGLARALVQIAVMLPDSHAQHRFSLAQMAAATGDVTAIALVNLWQNESKTMSSKIAWDEATTWKKIKQELALPHLRPEPPRQQQFERPQIDVIPRLLNQEDCVYLSTSSEIYMKPATVNDASQGETVDHSRTNSAMSYYPVELDVVVQSIRQHIANGAGISLSQAEVLSVLKYEPGQTYEPHYDFFDPQFPRHAEEIKRGGQRIKTALVYLNDDYQAGETSFEQLGWTFKGEPGDALIFSNVDDSGIPDRQTLHTGLPTESGIKYLASQWFRESL